MASGLRHPTYGDIILRILQDSDQNSLHFLSIIGLFRKGYLFKYRFSPNWRQLLLRAVRRLADEGSIVAEGHGNLVFRHTSKPLRNQPVILSLDGSDLSITRLLAKVELFPSTPPTSIVDFPDFNGYDGDSSTVTDPMLADRARFGMDGDLAAYQLECSSMESLESPNDKKVTQEAPVILAKRVGIRCLSKELAKEKLANQAPARNLYKTSLKSTGKRKSLGSFRRASITSIKSKCHMVLKLEDNTCNLLRVH